MPHFLSAGVRIAFERYAAGPPVLLIHGFASSGAVNWVATGWVETLTVAGYEAITIDNRGHGGSEKLYDPTDYTPAMMAADAANLLAHLRIERSLVVGYSMGARIAAFLAVARPDLVAAAVFGGMGMGLVTGLDDSRDIIDALLADDLGSITHPAGRQFRAFAERTGSDREALAACMMTSRQPMDREMVGSIAVPVLVAVGEADEMAGDPRALAALLPQGEAFVIPRRDHMKATGDAAFKAATLRFLQRYSPAAAIS